MAVARTLGREVPEREISLRHSNELKSIDQCQQGDREEPTTQYASVIVFGYCDEFLLC